MNTSVKVSAKKALTSGVGALLLTGAVSCMGARSNAGLSPRAQADQFLYRSDMQKLVYVQEDRVAQVINELRAHGYAKLEADLDKLDADFEKDPANELGYRDVIYGFVGCDGTDKNLEAELQAWTKARPKNAWSHLSLGTYYQAEACAVRGEGWASDVSDEQFNRVDEYLAKARPELEQAQQLDPRLPPIYWTLIVVAKMQSDLDAATQAMHQGIDNVPTSYLVAAQYMDTLSPRWLGSYEQMDGFAKSMLAYLSKNPRYWGLQGYVEAEKGDTAYRDNDFKTASLHYKAALTFVDTPSWLVFAGESARMQWDNGTAIAYYMRNARYEKPLSAHHKEVEENMLSNCKIIPKTCTMNPKDFPWYGEPGPHDAADENPLGALDIPPARKLD